MTAPKPPGNSVLKTLPSEVQEALWQAANTGTYEDCVAWLSSAHGVETSASALGRWFAWYGKTRLLVQAQGASQAFQEWIQDQSEAPLGVDQPAEMGNQAFLALALKGGGGKDWAALIRSLATWKKAQNDAAKIALLRQKMEQATVLVADEQIDDAERAARLRAIFGRE